MSMTKIFKLMIIGSGVLSAAIVQAEENDKMAKRVQRADITYEDLFASPRGTSATDPEFLDILQKFIFGEVFYVGKLDNKTRELITVVSLTALQTLPQLKAHINAALNVGNTPLEIREAIYQCAPFIGFPRTLNAIGVFNEVAAERGIKLPLENAATVSESSRMVRGREIQLALYGDEVKQPMSSLPAEYKEQIPEILTGFCFADFYTRKGLDIKRRELLSLAVLAAQGADKQLAAHIIGNLKAGNDKETMLAAMVQAIPYIGLPNGLTAINLIKETSIENYQPIYETREEK